MTTTTIDLKIDENGRTQLSQIPDDMADSKVYKAMVREFGEDYTRDFFKKSESDLRSIMAECQVQTTEATQEVEENVEFKRAKSVMNALKGGLRDTVKPLKIKSKAASMIVAYNNEVRRAK